MAAARLAEVPRIMERRLNCLTCIDSPLDMLDTRTVVGALGIVGLLSHTLSHYVVPHAEPTATFVVGSLVLFLTYYVLDFVLGRYLPSYARIADVDKRFYVLANLIKSTLLAALTPQALSLLHSTLFLDDWNNTHIKNMGSLYAITDFVSLFLARGRMKWTTVFHHVTVLVFNAFSIRNDYANHNICRAIMIYAIFSAQAYLVNALLASRFLQVSRKASTALSYCSAAIYIFSCALNWLWQAQYIRHLLTSHAHWTVYLYCCLLSLIVWDDLVLNRWLLQNAKNPESDNGARKPKGDTTSKEN